MEYLTITLLLLLLINFTEYLVPSFYSAFTSSHIVYYLVYNSKLDDGLVADTISVYLLFRKGLHIPLSS
uniref:Uncharacterized protein n=1 Tax=Glossina austeni TaxID=7395 RepID=A0A1A9UV59_GLOAU